MKKITLILITILIFSCGYKPVYKNKNLQNYNFKEIFLTGDEEINKQILSVLSINQNPLDQKLDNLHIFSSVIIDETSKNSKGQVETYKTKLLVKIQIKRKDEIIREKIFEKERGYGNKESKSDLIKYQVYIKNNLINQIGEDVLIYLGI